MAARYISSDPDFLLSMLDDVDSDGSDSEFDGYMDDGEDESDESESDSSDDGGSGGDGGIPDFDASSSGVAVDTTGMEPVDFFNSTLTEM